MRLINSFFTGNKTALSLFLILGCVCGMFFRYEFAYWDALNYHYYNPWAFLNNRLHVDVVPAAANTFFSPFIDFPYYFLVNVLNDRPLIFCGIMAIPYGLMLFFSYKISTLFFSADTDQGRIRIGLTLLLSICSETVFFQLCSSSNEHLMAFLVLAALYPLLKTIAEQRFNTGVFIFSGFVLGAAAGLKLTHAPYAAATGITLIFFHKHLKRPLWNIGLFTLAGVTGFLIAYGYWGWVLWKNFQNPFFPFFNSVFSSPYWDGSDYKDMRYFNKPWTTVLFYPFFSFLNIGHEVPLLQTLSISNLRFFVGAVIFLLVSTGLLKNRKKHQTEDNKFLLHLLMFWMAAVYVLWLFFFRVYRYLIPFELMLSIILIFFFFEKQKIDTDNKRVYGILFFVTFIIPSIFQNYPHYLKIPTEFPLIAAKPKPLPDDTLLVLNNLPSSVFIPFLAGNPTVRAVISTSHRKEYNGSNFYSRGYFSKKRNEIIQSYRVRKRPVVSLSFLVPPNGLCSRLAALDIPFFLCWEDRFFFFKPTMPINIWLDKTDFLSQNEENMKRGKNHAGTSRSVAR